MIYVCSPYRGDVSVNVAFAKRCCLEVIKAGKVPFAPHLYFTQFLDDDIPEERERGMCKPNFPKLQKNLLSKLPMKNWLNNNSAK